MDRHDRMSGRQQPIDHQALARLDRDPQITSVAVVRQAPQRAGEPGLGVWERPPSRLAARGVQHRHREGPATPIPTDRVLQFASFQREKNHTPLTRRGRLPEARYCGPRGAIP